MKPMSKWLFGLFAALAAGSASAQSAYPEKPVHVVVGFPAGSAPDIVARLLCQKLSESLGKPVPVEDIAGAAGNIAAERVARSAPDGYTLAFAANAQLIINPGLYKLSFDPIRDFAPISEVYLSPNILVVGNAVNAKSVRELVALAKAQPGALTFASGGSGSSPHLSGELFRSMAGVDIRHVPYKGGVAAIPDLLAGRVTMMFAPIPVAMPLVREGKLRALATTASERAPSMPELPTVAESGLPGYEVTLWGGLVAPSGTPAAIVQKLYAETAKALAQADLRGKFAELGVVAIGNSPEEFAAVIKSEIPRWAAVIREAGIKPD